VVLVVFAALLPLVILLYLYHWLQVVLAAR
jgi:hypothetical protein